MSDWSSFEKDKAITDKWRAFLKEEEEGPKKLKPWQKWLARRIDHVTGATKDPITGRRIADPEAEEMYGAPTDSPGFVARALGGTGSRVDTGTGREFVDQQSAVQTPLDSEASTAEDSSQYRKFKGYVIDVANDRKPDPIKIKQTYQDLSDEQKYEFQDFLDDNANVNPELVAYFTTTLGSVMEQIDLSLEEIIKEELLRVLNEEE
jgi:hypothetical protein